MLIRRGLVALALLVPAWIAGADAARSAGPTTVTQCTDTALRDAVAAGGVVEFGLPCPDLQLTGPLVIGAGANVDIRVTYTPPTGFTGTDSFIVSAEDGHAWAAPVTVRLTVGSTTPIPSPPPPPPPPPPVITPAQLAAALKADLGKDVAALRHKTVKSIRKARGAKMAFKWLTPGTATVMWRGHSVIARGTAARTSPGAGVVRVRLSAAGRKLFKRRRVPALKVSATFVDASSHAKVVAVSRFKLRH
jgi:hypothetical protein